MVTKEKIIKRGSLLCVMLLFVVALVAGFFLVDINGAGEQPEEILASH